MTDAWDLMRPVSVCILLTLLGSSATQAVDFGPPLVRLTAADAVVEPPERWTAPATDGPKRYRSARKEENCYLYLPRFWQGSAPSGLYVVTVEYRDTVGSPAVVMIYDAGAQSWGYHPMGNLGGQADGKWKTADFVVSGRHIALADYDSAKLRFLMAEKDLPIGTIKAHKPPAGQDDDLRKLHYQQLDEQVWQATQRMGKRLPFEETVQLEPVADAHQKLGFVPFVRSWLRPVYPNSVPTQQERSATIEAVTTLGEAEPTIVGLRSLEEELIGVRLTCGTLTAKDGATISSDALDVGVIEFAPIRWGRGSSSRDWRVHPVRIWPQNRFCGNRYAGRAEGGLVVPAHTTLAYWLTIRTPADVRPGLYTGKVTLTAGGQRYDFDLRLQVLPFRLVENRTWWIGQYINSQLDDVQCADLASHGVNATSQWPGGYEMRRVNDRWTFDLTAQDAYMRRLQAHGITGPHVWFQGNDRNHSFDKQICRIADVEIDSPEYFKLYAEAVSAMHRHAIQAGWNRLIWCIFDEPGKGGRAQERWLGDAKAVKEAMGEQVTLFCVVLNRGAERARQFLPYADIFSCNGKVDELVELAAKHGKEVWSYGGVNQRSDTATVRWAYGFNVWKSGVQGHYCWAYNWSADVPNNDFDGSHMDWMVSYADLDGTLIPTLGWEAFREGTEDLRYLLTLMSVLKAKADSPQAPKITAELAKLHASLSGAEAAPDATGIDVMGLEFVPADDNAVSRARMQIAAWIMALQK